MSELCGCGKPVRYQTPSGMACNKYRRCSGYEAKAKYLIERVSELQEEVLMRHTMALLEGFSEPVMKLLERIAALEAENAELRAELEKARKDAYREGWEDGAIYFSGHAVEDAIEQDWTLYKKNLIQNSPEADK